MPWWKPYPSTRAYNRNRSITRVGSNSPDEVYTQSQSGSDTDVDVGLEERSKRSKGESGAEVQSVEGAVEWEESEGGGAEGSRCRADLFLGPLICKAVGERRVQ